MSTLLTRPNCFARNTKSGFEPTKFVTFPGNAANFVGSAGSTKFEEFPGSATKNLQKKVPEWGPEKSSGTCRPGWGFQAKFGPDLIFKSGPKHQKWIEMDPESMVWAEHRSRSMPGPLRSVWDGSNPLQGAVPAKKVKKCARAAPGINIAMCAWVWRWSGSKLARLHASNRQ